MAQPLDGGGGSAPSPFAPQHTWLPVPEARRSSVASGRTDQLTRLVYELLDAHADTEQLSRTVQPELLWQAHLDYLRDLQRVARGVLAHIG
jgi:hypothetical protein